MRAPGIDEIEEFSIYGRVAAVRGLLVEIAGPVSAMSLGGRLDIEIAEISGKWKVSQNRPAPDRAGVASGLENPAMAALVRSYGGIEDAS